MIERKTMKHLKLKNKLPEGDALEMMLVRQRRINDRFYGRLRADDPLRQAMLKEYCLAAMAECVELLDGVNWKMWRKTQKNVNWREVTFEAIDLLHFVLSMFDVLGMNRDDVLKHYLAKSDENIRRQKNGY